ncbi:RNA pyrophosphohydrolase [Oryzibacter oryziterrae]|uniref:RNA pyrophosphohydrolase n=1 Tax=Oryzibacter oryziterrae TaxID=2766474 RepID=UPI001F272F4C|nr:RNA pyrophosphohydrolase [Oryzibacter oryziterrae]
MTHDRDRLPYRPCAGAMLINRDGLVFVGRRAETPAEGGGLPWQMPQGGIDAGETPEAAARRELYEETSVSSIELLAEAPDWYSYDIPDDLASGRFQRKWRGQTQKWCAYRFLGQDSEINILSPGGGHHKAEFAEWRWERLANLPGLVVAFKRPVYEQVCAAFAHLAVPQ